MSIAFKLSTLAIRTLAKPISVTLKSQAKQHATFRKICINVAQTTHRFDINMRMNLLGEKGLQHVRPLNEAKAIDSGANFISETFLFSVAGGLILFESWRSRRKETTRREGVADAIEALQNEVEQLRSIIEERSREQAVKVAEEQEAAKAVEKEKTKTAEKPVSPSDQGRLVRERAEQVRKGDRVADL